MQSMETDDPLRWIEDRSLLQRPLSASILYQQEVRQERMDTGSIISLHTIKRTQPQSKPRIYSSTGNLLPKYSDMSIYSDYARSNSQSSNLAARSISQHSFLPRPKSNTSLTGTPLRQAVSKSASRVPTPQQRSSPLFGPHE
jgi:hypothetical protein